MEEEGETAGEEREENSTGAPWDLLHGTERKAQVASEEAKANTKSRRVPCALQRQTRVLRHKQLIKQNRQTKTKPL